MKGPKGAFSLFGNNCKPVSTGDDHKISGGEVEFSFHFFDHLILVSLFSILIASNIRNGITESRFEALLCFIFTIKRISDHFSALMFTVDLFAFVVELDQSLQGLLSFERLDRASPDLWPEQSELQFIDLILSTDANFWLIFELQGTNLFMVSIKVVKFTKLKAFIWVAWERIREY